MRSVANACTLAVCASMPSSLSRRCFSCAATRSAFGTNGSTAVSSSSVGWMRHSASCSASSAGCTELAGSGESGGSSGLRNSVWFETIAPRIGSAGCDAYHPTTFERRPHCVRMFHSAFARRLVLAVVRMPAPSGSGSVNPSTPCASARLPVAMVFQRIGERIGRVVARLPAAPRSSRPASVGIRPCASSGSIICQSAASQPTRSTRRGRPGAVARDGCAMLMTQEYSAPAIAGALCVS